MRWRWLIGVPLVLIGGSCGALMSFAHIEATDHFEGNRKALGEAMTKYGDAFRADLRVASSLPLFEVTRSVRADGKDAGPFMAAVALVPPATAKAVNEVGVTKFPGRALAIDVSAVDVSWLRELATYDYWQVAGERPVSLATLKLPDNLALQAAARVRLLQGIKAGDAKSAGHDVHELTRLAASTELWTVLDGVAPLMQIERQAFEHARAEGLDVEGWDPPDRNTVEAVRRALRAYGGATDYHVDPALHRDLFTAVDTSAGRCAGLNDVASTLIAIEPMTGARYREPVPWVAKALEGTKATCRLTLVREAWDNPDQSALAVGPDTLCDAEIDAGTCVVTSILAWFPGIRDMQVEAWNIYAAELFSGYSARR